MSTRPWPMSAVRCWKPTSTSRWSGHLLDRIRPRAIGTEVLKSVTPGHQVIKVVHESLIETLGTEAVPLVRAEDQTAGHPDGGPPGIRQDHLGGQAGAPAPGGPASVSCWWRPIWCVRERSSNSGCSANRWTHPSSPAVATMLCRSSGARLRHARQQGFDVVVVDTAGRLQIDLGPHEGVGRHHPGDRPRRSPAGGGRDDRPGRPCPWQGASLPTPS